MMQRLKIGEQPHTLGNFLVPQLELAAPFRQPSLVKIDEDVQPTVELRVGGRRQPREPPRTGRHRLARTRRAAPPSLAQSGSSDLRADSNYDPTERLVPGAIFYTDRGSNYTSYEFGKVLAGLDLRRSMGRTGVCYDNAMAESFFAALKNELCNRTVYPNRVAAMKDIARYIETVTSQKDPLRDRIPSTNQVHNAYQTQQMAA